MDQNRIIDACKELVSIEVHSRDERAIADVLKEKLTALGLTVTEDKAGEVLGGNTGNLYAQLPGSADGEPVLFSAHMDRGGKHGHIVPLVKAGHRSWQAMISAALRRSLRCFAK